jgi:hypothetical protein
MDGSLDPAAFGGVAQHGTSSVDHAPSAPAPTKYQLVMAIHTMEAATAKVRAARRRDRSKSRSARALPPSIRRDASATPAATTLPRAPTSAPDAHPTTATRPTATPPNINPAAQTAQVPFAMLVLADHVRRGAVAEGCRCRVVIPSDGLVSVSLWDTADPEGLKQWLDEVLSDCISQVRGRRGGRAATGGAAGLKAEAAGCRFDALLIEPPPLPATMPP